MEVKSIFDKENIMMIEFIEQYGKLGEVQMVALFNKNKTTEQEAKEAIKLYPISENFNVVFMMKRQFENIFLKQEETVDGK
jgi:thiamine monophosphate synthase